MALRLGAAAADLAALVLLCVAVERWPGAVQEARRGAIRLSLTVRSRIAGPAIALLGAVLATGAVWSLHARWSRVPGTLEEPPTAEALTAASPDDAASSASGDSAEALASPDSLDDSGGMAAVNNRDPWQWGFGLAIALAVTVGVVSIVEVQRARREVIALAFTADRSTFLVGELGRWIGRLRTFALDQLVRPQREPGAEDREIAAITGALESAVRELEPLLQPRERAAWHSFLRVLGRFRGEIDRALSAIRGDRPAWARAVLIHRVPRRSARLQERLDEFRHLNAQESRALIAAVDGRLARTRALEAFLGGTLAIALMIIWWAVKRTIGRQREQLDCYVARLVASNEDLESFAARVAHDVRNTVAPLGFASVALRNAHGRPETVLHVAAQLERAVQSTQTLLDGLLAFSRARSSARPERMRVRRAVEEVMNELRPLAERIDARVEVRVDEVEVLCAPGLLHIVVANLMGNALKFLTGRPVRRVRVAAYEIDGWCELVVEDTGPGIPRDALPHIFEPFYRAPGAAAPGTGIGLATVRRVASAHGGSVIVESDPGRGSVFRVRLPLYDARSPEGCESDVVREQGSTW